MLLGHRLDGLRWKLAHRMKSAHKCECGCGQFTNLAKGNNGQIGVRRGEPYRFCAGHRRTFNNWHKDPSGCWIWTGRLNSGGYGQHRRVYERYKGLIPDGMTLDHLCRNRACVNPAHLEPVSLSENLRRIRPDGCSNGHSWTEANTYIHNGHRMCRACRARAARDFRERQSA